MVTRPCHRSVTRIRGFGESIFLAGCMFDIWVDILPFRRLVGEVFLECLKGSSLGTLPGVKGAWYI